MSLFFCSSFSSFPQKISLPRLLPSFPDIFPYVLFTSFRMFPEGSSVCRFLPPSGLFRTFPILRRLLVFFRTSFRLPAPGSGLFSSVAAYYAPECLPGKEKRALMSAHSGDVEKPATRKKARHPFRMIKKHLYSFKTGFSPFHSRGNYQPYLKNTPEPERF